MKTFNILPWYFLLLIIGLCASVMVTTEGMTREETVFEETPVDVLTTMTLPAILLVVAQRNLNTSKVTDVKNLIAIKFPNMNIKVFNSMNDKKANEFLKNISIEQLTSTTGSVVLKPNSAYNMNAPISNTNKPYITCKADLSI